MRVLGLVVIAALCASGAMAGPFVNGDFEDPYVTIKTALVPTGWTTYVTTGGMVWQLEPGGVQLPGSHQWAQMYTTVIGSVGGLYQTFDTNPGWTYTIKGTIAAVHAQMTARLGIVQGGWTGRPDDSDPAWILTTPSGSTAWHSVETPIVATGTSMTVIVDGKNITTDTKVSRVVKWDNIMVPEPASMIALLGGLLAFGLRRRK